MDILKLKKNYLISGRAATGIYAILKTHFFNKLVLLPCNICYAAIYPVIFSGNVPVFCDVDSRSGNVTLDLVKKVKVELSAMIIPHMFGNPVPDIGEIKQYCTEKNILLIEDCASSMGATVGPYETGSFGDYVVYSTGYSKTIDLGFGGIICSDFNLKNIERQLLSLPELNSSIKDSNTQFSMMYRAYRNGKKTIDDFLPKKITELSSNFLFRLSQEEKCQVIESLHTLSSTIELRRKKYHLYCKQINYKSLITPYEMDDGAVPWRFNILVAPEVRQILIRELLIKKGVPVSDWYPVVTHLFSDKGCYKGGELFERSILNLPLLCTDEKIEEYACALNSIVEELI